MDAGAQLVGDKGMPKIVDFGVFDTGFFEVAVDGGPDISDQQGVAGFGDEEMIILDARADIEVVLQGGSGGFVEGNGSLGVVFEDADADFVFAQVVHAQIGQFADPDAGLEEELDDGGNPDVQAGGVTQGAVLGVGQYARGFGLVLGVGEGGAGIFGVEAGFVEKLEEGL